MLPDFTKPLWIVLVTMIFLGLITGRYFLFAGIFYLIFYVWFPEKWKTRKINERNYKPGQLKIEVKWSMISAFLFSLAGTATVILWQKGYTRIYTELDEYGWWYLPASFIIFMLLHETYYYWLHRWMHKPAIFRIVHKVHHDSYITSPFTAFSFHPLEGLLQAIFLPIMLIILPMHYYVVIFQLTIMTISSVINHLDIEIYPQKFNSNFLGRFIIGASHHSLHHKQFKYNYGLYFTFWDKIKKTESPLFDKLFKSKTSKVPLKP
jgi:lathosterol oxidase